MVWICPLQAFYADEGLKIVGFQQKLAPLFLDDFFFFFFLVLTFISHFTKFVFPLFKNATCACYQISSTAFALTEAMSGAKYFK